MTIQQSHSGSRNVYRVRAAATVPMSHPQVTPLSCSLCQKGTLGVVAFFLFCLMLHVFACTPKNWSPVFEGRKEPFEKLQGTL
mmetsp:Transcript_77054/g.128408  ORF Transcript_77054/g.128408 Transcript_77054/m.128408 type:complete len:83 (-) Transcript_77054:130-378(-)